MCGEYIEITSLLRKRVPDAVWRWVHRTAFISFALTTLHAFTAGSDAGSIWIEGTGVVVGSLFLFLSLYRALAGRRKRPVPAAAAPAAAEAVAPSGQSGSTFHSLTVIDVIRETPEAVSVAFAVPKDLVPAFRFDPGQHLTLRTRLGGDEVRRAYSLCSGVTDGELRIAVKQVDGGRASGWLNASVAIGDVVDVAAPAGRFGTEINPLHERHLLGVAAGSGITPVLSILKSVLAVEPRSRFTLLYGNRSSDSIIFRDKLAALQERYGDRLQVVHVLSRCTEVEPRLRGRINADKVRELEDLLDLDTVDDAYLCGPREMTTEVHDALSAKGVERVHVELFGGRAGSTVTATGTGTSTATLTRVGVERRVGVVNRGTRTDLDVRPDESVLDAALRIGLDLPYSCRDGVCGTCVAKLTCGVVQQDLAELTPEEVAAGLVLTCQARPQTDDVVITLNG